MRFAHLSSRMVAAWFVSLLLITLAPAASIASSCVAPDSGGTVTLPNAVPTVDCPTGYTAPAGAFQIINGLPGGDTIDIVAEQTSIACGASTSCSFGITPGVDCNDPGGSLGGGMGCATSVFHMNMTGTGTLSGFTRTIDLPIDLEHHFAPRIPGDLSQSFDTVVFRMFGQIAAAGDPDFDLLRILAGNDFGLPSPGHTTLVAGSGGRAVDSFFDLTYRIDFIGAAGGALAGRSGSTTATIRIQLGDPTVYDHLECFKMKDALRVSGVVNLPALAGTPYDAAGCTVSSARKYCKPAAKVVVSSMPTITPMPGPNLTSDYVCYKIRCPQVDLSEGTTDQFGTHALTKMRQSELCVPAVPAP